MRAARLLAALSLSTLLCLSALPASAEPLRIELVGVEDELQAALTPLLALPPGLVVGEQVNLRWLKRFEKQLPARLSGQLEPYGYFHSRITTRILEEPPGQYLLTVEVEPGDPLRVTQLELEASGPGAQQAHIQKLLDQFPLQVGDVLRQDHYEQGEALLKSGAADLGYLDADFTAHQIRVHRGDRQAEITLHFASGPRYRFGVTSLSGGGDYPERFLRRYLSYRQGEIFSHAKLGQTQVNLLGADLFRSVSIRPLPEAAQDEEVPVSIELAPAPRHQLRPGLGYGTDTGARGSLRYRNLNLFKLGHELQGDLLLAELRQSLVTSYIIPDLDDLESRTQLQLGFDREKTDTYTTRTLFSEAEYQRSVSDGLRGSLFVRLSQEQSTIGGDETRSQLLLPGLRLNWRRVDDPLNPRRGSQLRLELQGAQQTFFSDTSLLQLSGQASHLQPLPRQLSLQLRLRGGTTWHNDPLRDLPVSLRFFAGGDRSVRGYRYQSLGPKDENGHVVGGKHLLVGNIELEKRLTDNWGIATFYDIGNAFDSFAEYELQQSAGLGVRRYTRIGPLRVDLARQLGTASSKYRLHLSLGVGW